MQTAVYSNGVWQESCSREADLGLHRNEGGVEVLVAKGDVPFHWYDHHSRLRGSCGYYGISLEKLLPGQKILEQIKLMLSREGCERGQIHVLVTSGDSEDLKTPSSSPRLSLNIWPFFQGNPPPLSVMPVNERRIVPRHKLTFHYGNVGPNLKKAKEAGFDSFLYSDEKDGLLEGPYENLFFVNDAGELITPAFGALPGVTRRILLNLAQKSGLRVLEQPVRLWHLRRMKEAFFSSTTKGAAAISKVGEYEHFEVGERTLTAQLKKLFFEYQERYYSERGA
ncbi:MAG: aminotransferase class IV family protein [Candidatus Giovannonibacteria bacterium]|nr:MAG: aminotransferase class IV family protein [Candidatus Giovannonibacteria bacterium]